MYQVTNYMIQLILKVNCGILVKASGNYNSKELSLKADGIKFQLAKWGEEK